MSKAEQRDGLEKSVANLEVFEGAITTAAEQLAERMGELASEGVSIQDLEWTGRVSDVAERIMGPLERLFNEINEVPTDATIVEEEAKENDKGSERAGLQGDLSHIASGGHPSKVVQAKTASRTLSEREQQIWERINSGGSKVEWFGQKDLDMESIGFSSPSAKNQAFSQFCKKAIAAGILIDNGKERGGRRYVIASNAPTQLASWDLSETSITGEGETVVQESEATTRKDGDSPSIELEQEAPGKIEKTYDLKLEVIIKGKVFSFAPLEYKIIKALLEGKGGTKEIIAHLNGHEGLEEADPDFYYNEFQPALKRLQGLLIGDTPLVKARLVEGPGGKFTRFGLPDGARLDSKKGVETLRFTDSSSHAGTPTTKEERQRRRLQQDTTALDTSAPNQTKSQAGQATQKDGRSKSSSTGTARVTETGLVDSTGKSVSLEPQAKAILNILLSGKRLTVADIAKEINAEAANDSTFKSIVADELATLQRLVGSASLRRKQKSGTQARWWLETA